jgi:hypothetical protein
VNRNAVCTSSDRPIRSANSAADVQCEWMSCEICPRALAYSVAAVFSRDSSDSPRPMLVSRKRWYGSPDQSTRYEPRRTAMSSPNHRAYSWESAWQPIHMISVA